MRKKYNIISLFLMISIIINLILISNLSKQIKHEVQFNGVEKNKYLSVNNGSLVNYSGDQIQLKGISSHGLMWYPEYTNYRSLNTIKSYGANVFRIAMYSDQDKGYVYSKKDTKKIFLSTLENVLGSDMYAIVDWHTLKDNNPNTHIKEAKGFFDEISKMYKDEPGIIYEILNEANGDTTWEDIKKYADEIIPIIRKNSPNALILVGTPNHCVDIKSALDYPLNYDNIMYTYHMYTGSSDYGYEYILGEAIENSMPVFVSEWGLSVDKETSKIDFEEGEKFINYLSKHNISWVNWSLSNKDEPYSSIRPDVNKLSNWKEEDLTDVGRFIFKAFS